MFIEEEIKALRKDIAELNLNIIKNTALIKKQNTKTERRAYTLKEAGTLFGKSESWIWQHITAGDLQPIKIGEKGHYHITPEEMDRFCRDMFIPVTNTSLREVA